MVVAVVPLVANAFVNEPPVVGPVALIVTFDGSSNQSFARTVSVLVPMTSPDVSTRLARIVLLLIATQAES